MFIQAIKIYSQVTCDSANAQPSKLYRDLNFNSEELEITKTKITKLFFNHLYYRIRFLNNTHPHATY